MRITDFLKRENNNLDLVRIMLACLVIVGHSPILNGSSYMWVDPIQHFFKFTYSGAIAVKLFFFISGLLVTNSLIIQKNPVQFITSRFFRLMPALFFVLVLTVLLVGPILTSMKVSEYFSDSGFLSYFSHNILFRQYLFLPGVFESNFYHKTVNGSLWSLAYEVKCYIALLIIFLFLKNTSKRYWNIVFLIILVGTLLHSKFSFGAITHNPDIYLLFVSFAFGAFCAIHADKIKLNLQIVAGMILFFYILKDTSYAQLFFIPASGITVLYLASIKFVLKLRPKYDISYGVYLWGFLVQQTIFHYCGHMYVGFHCLLAIIISVLLGLITNIIIEKPFIKFGKYTYTFLQDRIPTIELFRKRNN